MQIEYLLFKNKELEEIKKLESPPKVIDNIFNQNEINDFLKLYSELPLTVHNKKQNVIKKRWLQGFNTDLEKKFFDRVGKEIGHFKLDNLKDDNGKDIFGLIQESYNPIGLHVDAGFEINSQIYKQTLIPLSSVGSTVIFKNRFYNGSTSFTQDPEELNKKLDDEKYKNCKMLLQIHDELIFEIPKNEEKSITKVIMDEMVSVKDSDLHSFSTPLTVDINTGENWGLLH